MNGEIEVRAAMEVKCHAWPYLAGGKDRKISDMIKKDFYPEESN
jgi:hypothetical protein